MVTKQDSFLQHSPQLRNQLSQTHLQFLPCGRLSKAVSIQVPGTHTSIKACRISQCSLQTLKDSAWVEVSLLSPSSSRWCSLPSRSKLRWQVWKWSLWIRKWRSSRQESKNSCRSRILQLETRLKERWWTSGRRLGLVGSLLYSVSVNFHFWSHGFCNWDIWQQVQICSLEWKLEVICGSRTWLNTIHCSFYHSWVQFLQVWTSK